jgi:DNA polymerase
VSDGRALAREFLEQQRILGGPFVIRGSAAAARTDGRADSRTAGPSDGEDRVPSGSPPVTLSAGVSFDPPSGDFFTADPIAQATALAGLDALIAACTKCKLCEGRTRTVPGEGPGDARLMVVGEGPGRVEDETGRPFVGPAGELLTKILAAIDLPRAQVYICNIVKCRPPENRQPQYDEIAACLPYLYRQIEIVKPAVILAMGNTAAQSLLATKQSLGALRNRLHRFRGTPVIVTYHPAALLRNPNWKRPTWDDVRIARRLLDG